MKSEIGVTQNETRVMYDGREMEDDCGLGYNLYVK